MNPRGGKYGERGDVRIRETSRVGIVPAPRSWCYICGTAHSWAVACPAVDRAKMPGRYAVSS